MSVRAVSDVVLHREGGAGMSWKVASIPLTFRSGNWGTSDPTVHRRGSASGPGWCGPATPIQKAADRSEWCLKGKHCETALFDGSATDRDELSSVEAAAV
jgi:hypothetical protein